MTISLVYAFNVKIKKQIRFKDYYCGCGDRAGSGALGDGGRCGEAELSIREWNNGTYVQNNRKTVHMLTIVIPNITLL